MNAKPESTRPGLSISRSRRKFGHGAPAVTVAFAPRGYDPARPKGCWSWHWSLTRYATCSILRWPGLMVVVNRKQVQS